MWLMTKVEEFIDKATSEIGQALRDNQKAGLHIKQNFEHCYLIRQFAERYTAARHLGIKLAHIKKYANNVLGLMQIIEKSESQTIEK
jgi:hypothetical protein